MLKKLAMILLIITLLVALASEIYIGYTLYQFLFTIAGG